VTRSRTIRRNLTAALPKLGRWESWQRLGLRVAIRYLGPERPRRVPTSIQIEATNKCNLRCPSCSHAREMGSGQHLTSEGLQKILERLPSTPTKVRLSGIGEPLVNPHFFSLVDILAGRGVKCDFITNGTLLTPDRCDAILSRHNIEEVVISCDGAQKATFESLRLGADFESWKHQVRQFVAKAKHLRRETLCVSSSVVISMQNLNELGDIIRLVSGLGFDKVTLLAPIPVDDVAASLCPSQAEMSTIREDNLFDLARALGVGLSCGLRRPALLPKQLPRCLQPWEYVFIRTDGAVAPCCALFGSDKGVVVGNIFQQTFADIWRGDRFREFRRTSALGTNSLCHLCPYY